jgi:hypothetical protein
MIVMLSDIADPERSSYHGEFCVTQSCNLLPAFLGGAWAAVLIAFVSIGAGYCVGLLRKPRVDAKDEGLAVQPLPNSQAR